MAGWSPRDSDPCNWNGVSCVDGRVVMLKLKDLSLKGTLGPELGTLSHLRALFLSSNSFQWPLIQNSYGNIDQENSFHVYDNSREIYESKLRMAHIPSQFAARNPTMQLSQRRLLQDSNLAAPSSGNDPIPAAVPSTGSGSFSAFISNIAPEPAVNPPTIPSVSPSYAHRSFEGRSIKWIFAIVIPLILLLLIGIACVIFLCRNKSVKTIGPWKTGLSGPAPKGICDSALSWKVLVRTSVILLQPIHITLYIREPYQVLGINYDYVWQRLVKAFRRAIQEKDSLSRINHKNFINLLGYCEEEEPFMRMMVLEYAPNGTLYEHLHVEGFDPIDWNGRMRVIMGVAYCIQHMHDLNPPIAHPDLKSSAILLSEDGAAK
ncbi:hypothetical protein EJB05_17478, partial [Eragrostis curvula]